MKKRLLSALAAGVMTMSLGFTSFAARPDKLKTTDPSMISYAIEAVATEKDDELGICVGMSKDKALSVLRKDLSWKEGKTLKYNNRKDGKGRNLELISFRKVDWDGNPTNDEQSIVLRFYQDKVEYVNMDFCVHYNEDYANEMAGELYLKLCKLLGAPSVDVKPSIGTMGIWVTDTSLIELQTWIPELHNKDSRKELA